MSTISPAEYETRIRQLEKLNAALAEQIDRMRPVVSAVQAAVVADRPLPLSVITACNEYVEQMAALTREVG